MRCKKHITTVVTAILSITMLAGLLTACTGGAGENQAFAYLTIAQELIPFEYIEDEETDVPRFFIINLSEAKIEDKDAVYNLIAAHVKVVGAEVARGDELTFNEITNLDTEDDNPTMLTFRDEKLTRTKLVTTLAVSWPRRFEGYGTKYTIKNESGTWKITASEPTQIS
ncbi:hypothetical protein AGMMS49983_15110 [Clostridia bacterium]|nr:hypothetical protein AGMMS49983_15110 [Clostridia bacterium]